MFKSLSAVGAAQGIFVDVEQVQLAGGGIFSNFVIKISIVRP